eukprot:COSAG01_NODE_1497_length_10121_cov_74.291359_6_plen_56_part_00
MKLRGGQTHIQFCVPDLSASCQLSTCTDPCTDVWIWVLGIELDIFIIGVNPTRDF